jgi:hypothetical protein
MRLFCCGLLLPAASEVYNRTGSRLKVFDAIPRVARCGVNSHGVAELGIPVTHDLLRVLIVSNRKATWSAGQRREGSWLDDSRRW